MAKEPIPLYSTQQLRDAEAYASTHYKVTASELMDRAGAAAFTLMKKAFPKVQKLMIYCGSGNNAGDGYVLAKLCFEAGYDVVINQFKLPEKLPPTAQQKAYDAIALGIPILSQEEQPDNEADLIIDALLGTGLQGSVKDPISSAINQINEAGIPVFSLDIPSGLEADSGLVLGSGVKATCTISFIGHKQGFYTLDGPDHCGTIFCHTLNIEPCLSRLKPSAHTLAPSPLTKRPKNCHKGDFGHVLIIGSGMGMPGATYLAAMAALRVGAGAVTIARHPLHHETFNLPEAMVYGISEADSLDPLLKRATVCIIGPGLGTDSWAEALFLKVMSSPLPMVIDASALHLLASAKERDDHWVLTPHPGEAAALLGSKTKDIQKNRFTAVRKIQEQYGGTVVLKGSGSLVETDDGHTFLCMEGNPGMATAGMGDVLTGVIAGLVAQQISLPKAACLGVSIHAKAADLACQTYGPRGIIASDLMPYLRQLVNI